jgi:hypothetical protein
MADSLAHAQAAGEGPQKASKFGSNGPIAPRLPGLPQVFRRNMPKPLTMADPTRPKGHALVSAWNLLGCHRVSSVNEGAKPVLALHHSVTTFSVKKRLMERLTFGRRESPPESGTPLMQRAHSFDKIGARYRSAIASVPIVKE